MADYTETQQSIITYAKENPNATGKEIAEVADCSPSYANKIRNENLDAIIGENDLSGFSKEITLAHPYEILVSDECMRQLDISEQEVVELEIEMGEDTISFRAPIKRANQLDDTRELHSYVYGVTELGVDVPSSVEEKITDFLNDGSDEEISIYTENAFKDYVERLIDVIDQKHTDADILVGIGLLAHGLTDISLEGEHLELPRYSMDKAELCRMLSYDRPELIDVRKFEGECTSVDRVIFSCDGKINESNKEKIKEKIREVGFIDLNLTYVLPHEFSVFDPKTFESNSGVIDVRDSSIEIQRSVLTGHFFGEENHEFDEIAEIISNADFSIEESNKEHNVTVEIDETSKKIHFHVNSFYLNISYDEDGLIMIYPSELESIKKFVDGLGQFLSKELSEAYRIDSIKIGPDDPVQSDTWLFDTNAIYHQIIGNIPSSILKTILPNPNLYNKEFIIPWPVLHEINKHKDDSDSGPAPSVQQVGLDNLEILKLLHEYSFIDLNVDNVPHPIQTKVSASHVADLHVLQKAQSSEAVLISGDERLRRLAQISDISVVDIHSYAVVEDDPDLSTEIWDQVHSQIGNEIHNRKQITQEINKKQSETIENQFKDYRNISQPEPATYLNQWVENEKVIPYPYITEDNGKEIRYHRAVSQDVVITPSVSMKLANHIVEYDGKKYLSKNSLDQLGDTLNLPSPGLPLITFHVPVSTVLGSQSISMGGLSTEARQLYKVEQLANANYNVTEIEGGTSGKKVHASVQLAREQQFTVLCTDPDSYIDPIGRLLGVDVREFDIEK